MFILEIIPPHVKSLLMRVRIEWNSLWRVGRHDRTVPTTGPSLLCLSLFYSLTA